MATHPVYELLEPIGVGTFATVYRARDLALKRDVAVKELAERFRLDPRHSQRLWEEAQFLAKHNHEHIVQIHALDKERGWIIMELMQGSLDACVAQKRMPADLVRSVLRQTLLGLQFLHEQHKVHGAIKPANLLINERGRVKLSDSAGLDVQGEVRKPEGSAKYLAPELINPEFGPVGPGVDLYCLGFTGLELLKGPKFDALFKGVDRDAADPQMGWLRVHGSRSERLPLTRELASGVPADLARVIDRLLAKDVSQRYASAGAALQDMEEHDLLAVDLPAPRALPGEQTAVTLAPSGVIPAPAATPVPPGTPQQAQPPRVGKPWSREWLNHQLSRPQVLYPLLALIALPTLIFFFWPESEGVPSAPTASPATGTAASIDDNQQKKVAETDSKLTPSSPASEKTRVATAHLEKGRQLLSMSKPAEALTELNKAVELDPALALAYAYRALAYEWKHDYDRAIAECNRALKIDPKCAAALAVRGEAYADKKDFDKALADLERAIKLDAKLPMALRNRGYAYSRKGEYDRAIVDYDAAIRLDGNYVQAYISRGVAYRQKKEYQKAIQDFNQAIRLNSSNVLAFNNRGVVYNGLEDYERATQDFSAAIQLDRKYAAAFNNRGLASYGKKEYDMAIQDFDEAIRLNPKDAMAFNNRGLAFYAKKDYDRAIQELDEAVRLNAREATSPSSRLDPKYAMAFNNRGLAFYAKKDYDRAIQDLDEAIRLNPKYAIAFNNRGLTYYAKKGYDRAIQDLDEAIYLNPKDPTAFNNRANAYEQVGAKEKAEADRARAKQLMTGS